MIIKKWNSNEERFDELYPKTTTNQIYGYNTATSEFDLNLFDDYGKLNEKYLPNVVYGGLNFKDVLDLTGTADTITNILYNWSATWQTLLKEGDYFQVGTGGKITGYGGETGTLRAVVFDENGETYEGGSDEASEEITVEAGDWIVYTQKQVFVDGSTYTTYYFSIVNNEVTYATTVKYGLTRFATSDEITNKDDIPAAVNPDNVVTIVGTSNAATADKWSSARTLSLTGAVTGSASIDGSGNVSLQTSVNHTHTEDQITVDGVYLGKLFETPGQTQELGVTIQAIADTRMEMYASTSEPTAINSNAIWFDLN